MVKLFGKSLLHWQLDALKSVDLEKVVIVGGYYASKIDAPSCELVINENFSETNMVASLFCASEWLSSEHDILVVYGDVIFEKRIIISLIESLAPITVSVDTHWRRLWEERMANPLDDAETLKLSDRNKIVEIGKRPKCFLDIEGQYRGLVKIRADMISTVCKSWQELQKLSHHDGRPVAGLYMTSFIQYLINTGVDVRADLTMAGWLEIDTVEDFLKFDSMYQRGVLSRLIDIKAVCS